MKKYEYVNVKIGKFIGAKSEEHRQIIDVISKNTHFIFAQPKHLAQMHDPGPFAVSGGRYLKQAFYR